ncbi:MAG: hypothetical protein KDD52_03860 [Bdellovibrionales bacterium]|nr:hypothetical protein [Bdellovibrionales bacterium]
MLSITETLAQDLEKNDLIPDIEYTLDESDTLVEEVPTQVDEAIEDNASFEQNIEVSYEDPSTTEENEHSEDTEEPLNTETEEEVLDIAPEKTSLEASEDLPQDKETSTELEEDSHQPSSKTIAPIQNRKSSLSQSSISLKPGFLKLSNQPSNFDDKGVALSAQLHYFFHPYFGINLPYSFLRVSGSHNIHSVGAGAIAKYIDWRFLRGTAEINTSYVRVDGDNRMSINGGFDLGIGSRKTLWQPFIGPYFRYENIFVPGKNLVAYSFGISLNLSNWTE